MNFMTNVMKEREAYKANGFTRKYDFVESKRS
jgi:hypothetical protein